jgi:hypothetical protein
MTTTQVLKAQADPFTGSAYHACRCEAECPARTRKSFAQGHDARMASRLAQAVADGTIAEAEEAATLIRLAGGSELLVNKMLRSAESRKGKPSKASKTHRDQPTGLQAADARIADRQEQRGLRTGREVTVVHGKKTYKAVMVRNAAGVLMARHRLLGRDCDHPGCPMP